MTDRAQLLVPAHALPARTARELLALARRGLTDAADMGDGMRYATAHLAALRAAAAVLAARATHAPGQRSKVTNVWSLLMLVTPELTEWATFFAVGASERAVAEAGIPRVVTGQEADELVRSAGVFLDVVETMLGGGGAVTLRAWLEAEYVKAQTAARTARLANEDIRVREGPKAVGCFHVSAVARMCALGETIQRLDLPDQTREDRS